MAVDTINVQFRKEIGVIDTSVSDDYLEDTIIPRALADFNATCRQTFTISDFSNATVGVTEDYYELVDSIIALLACYEAWRASKRKATTRMVGNVLEFPEYKSYLHDAWDIMARLYPALMVYEATRPGGGGYVPSMPEMHGMTKRYSPMVVGDGVIEGGVRYVPSTTNVTESDR